MKLLLDENLSHRLLEAIQYLFPGSVHVSQAGLSMATPDRKIWDYALHNGFIILTADTGFISLANAFGPPPKVILLENCDYPTTTAAEVIRANAAQIAKFETNQEPLLILRKPQMLLADLLFTFGVEDAVGLVEDGFGDFAGRVRWKVDAEAGQALHVER